MPRLPRHLLIATALAVSLSACSGQSEEQPRSAGRPAPTLAPFEQYAANDLVLQRTDPCPLLTKTAAEALQGTPDDERWGPGEAIPRLVDSISHEWGCEFTNATSSVSAWVAVPAVTQRQARDWVALKTPGCTLLKDSPEFGSPGLGQLCQAAAQRTVRFQGLYGDTWVGCQVTQTTDDLAELQRVADEWCGAVLQAAQTQPDQAASN